MNYNSSHLTEEEAMRTSIALTLYVAIKDYNAASDLHNLIKKLLRTAEPPEDILTALIEHDNKELSEKVRDLADIAYKHFEKQRLLRPCSCGKTPRLILLREEKFRIGHQVKKDLERLYGHMSRREAYKILSEESMDRYGMRLTPGQIENKYRWIIKQRDEDRAPLIHINDRKSFSMSD